MTWKELFLVLFSGVFFQGCSNKVNFALPPASQDFAQDIKYNSKVDILFVVDNSQSMSEVQSYVYNQLPSLVDYMVSKKMDFHIASTTTTMLKSFSYSGRFWGEPRFVSTDMPNFADAFKSKILVGEGGSTIERGLDSLEAVLSENYLNGEGKGFLRSDSFLNIIVLSNEDDESDFPWTHYAEMLDKIHPNYSEEEKAWALHFFGVLSFDDKCPSSDWGFYKSPGFKYLDLVKYSSGVKGSICGNDLTAALSGIKSRITQILTDYKLNEIPNLTTVKVYVNDQPVVRNKLNGWDYITSLNLIRFYGNAIPPENAKIKVDYKPLESN